MRNCILRNWNNFSVDRLKCSKSRLPLSYSTAPWINLADLQDGWGGRDLWRSPSPPLLLRQGHLVPTTVSTRVWNISKDGDSTTPLGNWFPHFTLTVKVFSHTFKENFLCFNLCPLLLILPVVTTQLPPAALPLHAGVSLGGEQALSSTNLCQGSDLMLMTPPF